MKRLIVNADDFGISERRNAGILEAHRRGIVTAVSLLANGSAWDDALRLLREAPELDVGLHLNLSEGPPLVAGHRTLVDPDGEFHGKAQTRKFAELWRLDPAEIERETEAQIRRLLDAGFRISHLDGHQHLHVWRAVAEPVARVARSFEIAFVRRPKDRWADAPGVPMRRAVQAEEYRRRTAECEPTFSEFGLRSTDHFGGSALSGYLTADHLSAILQTLPEGSTEFMVHPGFAEPARERESRVLTDPTLPSLLRERGIELTTFANLP